MARTPLALLVMALLIPACGGTSRTTHAIKLAKQSDPLFAIFPDHPGTTKCLIPHGGPLSASRMPLRGICVSTVSTTQTQTTVTFHEQWAAGLNLPASTTAFPFHHTWRMAVVGTRVSPLGSSGNGPPQLWS